MLNEKSKTLITMITKSIEINNNQYKKKLKKKMGTELSQIETTNFISRKSFI